MFLSALPRAHVLRVAALAFLPMLGLSACGGNDDDNRTFRPRTPSDTYAITTDNRLINFDRDTPGTVWTAVPVGGLAPGETLVGLDVRPSDGQLYGLVSAAAGAARVVTIDSSSGVSTALFGLVANDADASDPYTGLQGTRFGIDFNPVPDALRIVSDTGQNLRVAMTTAGATTAGETTTDTPLTRNSTTATGVTAAAYTNAFADACRTTLYYLDTTGGALLTTTSPNDGVLTSVGSLGVTPSSGFSAFEITTASDGSNTAFAALATADGTQWVQVDLATGATTPIGLIGGSVFADEPVIGIAMAPPTSSPSQAAGELYGLTEGNRLISFNRGAPSKLCTSVAATGLAVGENLLGIDFRPSNGLLYGLTSMAEIVTIDTSTGASTVVSTLAADTVNDPSPDFAGLSGTDFGVDFNPVPDRLRVVSNTGQNLRINVATGATITDGALNSGATSASSAAYTNSVGGAGATTLYVVDGASDQLYTQNPPNNGTLTATPAALGIDVNDVGGFDIDGRDNVALLAASLAGTTGSNLYTVNLTTGAASASLGIVGGAALGERIRGLSRPVPRVTLLGLRGGTELVSLSLASPGVVTSIGTVSGLGGQALVGIDFRPATGVLYGMGSGGSVFTIDPVTAAATAVAVSAATTLTGTSFGVDFNPVPDLLRVVSDARQNLRIDPGSGTLNTADGTLTYVTGVSDPNEGQTPSVVAAAYGNNFAGVMTTTLYDIDVARNVLARQAPPNNGTLNTVGTLLAGAAFTPVAGFDIAGTSASSLFPDLVALAVLQRTTGDTRSRLYRVDLSTGAVSDVVGGDAGFIGASGSAPISALAIRIQ